MTPEPIPVRDDLTDVDVHEVVEVVAAPPAPARTLDVIVAGSVAATVDEVGAPLDYT